MFQSFIFMIRVSLCLSLKLCQGALNFKYKSLNVLLIAAVKYAQFTYSILSRPRGVGRGYRRELPSEASVMFHILELHSERRLCLKELQEVTKVLYMACWICVQFPALPTINTKRLVWFIQEFIQKKNPPTSSQAEDYNQVHAAKCCV